MSAPAKHRKPRYERMVQRQMGLRGRATHKTQDVATRVGNGLAVRLHKNAGGFVREQLNKVFPENWSFLLGEIALYSFITLILTGTFLTFWYTPSDHDVTYTGDYAFLKGSSMSEAYKSVIDISFDVRGGLFVRQVHHWAALLFIASMIVHMSRIFFTGAFRKPRDINWIVGLSLMGIGTVEGFAGYSLPDDLLSGLGLRIGASIMESIPVIGTYLQFIIWGGAYPGEKILERLYIAHVFILPGLLIALIGLHISLIVRQKHTEFPAPGRTEKTVSGERLFPTYAAKGQGFMFIVIGALCALGGLVQINPIYFWGPYHVPLTSSYAQPDWYMLFIEGAMRLFPSWEIRSGGYDVPPLFWPCVMMPLVLFLLALTYPWVEARMTHDTAHHNLLQRPRDVPVRTSLGVMALIFYTLLVFAGSQDVIAQKFSINLNGIVWAFRIIVLVVPPLAYTATYRLCLWLQFKDREVLEEGIETGVIIRTPVGDYVEIKQPLGPKNSEGEVQLKYAGAPVPKRMNELHVNWAKRAYGFFHPISEDNQIDAVLKELEAAERREQDEILD